ncbi:MAG: GNAT family N-acetyltransferase, partial [Mariniphaga sp.]|nr:GNAT family N-acetyltransferase [Mariniphaga sp.]
GMQAMDGPVNFGENFFNWGLLADGYKQQTFGMQYQPEYYQNLFEDYGFRIYYKQYSYRMDISNPDLPERFWKIAAWRAKKPNLNYEHFKFRNKEKYICDFIKVHEQAWQKHWNFKKIDPDDIKELLKNSKYIFDEEFLWYAYYNDEPVAFFMMLPDLNQILKKINSDKLGLINIIRFFNLKRKKTITRCRVIVLGVVPKLQRTGVESGIFHQVKQVMLRKPWYTEMEMSWVGDFNPKMNALFKSFGAKRDITHYTMRYLFDRKKPFQRMPIIDE